MTFYKFICGMQEFRLFFSSYQEHMIIVVRYFSVVTKFDVYLVYSNPWRLKLEISNIN